MAVSPVSPSASQSHRTPLERVCACMVKTVAVVTLVVAGLFAALLQLPPQVSLPIIGGLFGLWLLRCCCRGSSSPSQVTVVSPPPPLVPQPSSFSSPLIFAPPPPMSSPSLLMAQPAPPYEPPRVPVHDRPMVLHSHSPGRSPGRSGAHHTLVRPPVQPAPPREPPRVGVGSGRSPSVPQATAAAPPFASAQPSPTVWGRSPPGRQPEPPTVPVGRRRS
jgi:hypothetical protein